MNKKEIKAEILKILDMDIFERPSSPEFYKLIIDFGCPVAPCNSYTNSMMAAIVAGLKKDDHTFNQMLENLPNGLNNPSNQKQRATWCRKVVKQILSY